MTPEEHRDEVEAWRAEREARLRRPHGWLSLAGLHWLSDGVVRIGSAAENDVVLPAGPPVAGRIEVADGRARVWAVPGSGLVHEGVEPAGLELRADVDDDGPTALDLGLLRLVVIRRGERLAVRLWDADAPLLRSFRGLDAYPIAIEWRLMARFEPTDAGTTVPIPDVLGTVAEEALPGRVAFEVDGETHRLAALEGGERGELWLIFHDATNEDETYPGGRYLYTPPVAADGSVVVDFNRAYNPPCVFTPYATCPLPPPENRLPIRVEAGERRWVGGPSAH